MQPKPQAEPRHPIGVVSSRTGLPQDLIRAWERRYAAVIPTRGGTGRRLYSDLDVERLRLLKRAVAAGRRISDVATLGEDELRGLIAEDGAEEAAPAIPRGQTRPESAGHILEECVAALEKMDRTGLEHALSSAAISLSTPHLRRQVIVPLMQVIGERWREGTVRVAQEHMATAVVRSFLSSMRPGTHGPSARRMLLTTPAGQQHELGALMAASAADEAGWDVVYLGPDLPAEEIAAAARQLDVDAVALSVIYGAHDRRIHDEIRKLRQYLDADIPLYIGGRAVLELGKGLEAEGIHAITDLDEFQSILAAIGN